MPADVLVQSELAMGWSRRAPWAQRAIGHLARARESAGCWFLAFGAALCVVVAGHPADASPAVVADRVVRRIPLTMVKADLHDPETILVPLVGGRSAPGLGMIHAPIDFARLAPRVAAAAIINGTYIVDRPDGVFGTIVQAGELLTEAYEGDEGTAFGLRRGNVPEMLTGAQRQGAWRRHWFSVQAGPRLLRAGRPDVLGSEGFRDPSVIYGAYGRSAIGFSKDGRWLYMVSFHRDLTRGEAAAILKDLGAWDAMGLDGGGSRGLAVAGKVRATPTRTLTSVLALFDARHPAPAAIRQAFRGYTKTQFVPPAGPAALDGRRDVWSKAAYPVEFAGWRFSWVLGDGSPRIKDDQLHIAFDRASRAYARAPIDRRFGAVLERYTLHYEARLEGAYHALFFDANPVTGTPRTNGLALIYGAFDDKPQGLHLYSEEGRGFWPGFAPGEGTPSAGRARPRKRSWFDRLAGRSPAPVVPSPNPPGTGAIRIDRSWHAFDISLNGTDVEEVRLDGQLVFRKRPRSSGHEFTGIILAGHATLRNLVIKRLPT